MGVKTEHTWFGPTLFPSQPPPPPPFFINECPHPYEPTRSTLYIKTKNNVQNNNNNNNGIPCP